MRMKQVPDTSALISAKFYMPRFIESSSPRTIRPTKMHRIPDSEFCNCIKSNASRSGYTSTRPSLHSYHTRTNCDERQWTLLHSLSVCTAILSIYVFDDKLILLLGSSRNPPHSVIPSARPFTHDAPCPMQIITSPLTRGPNRLHHWALLVGSYYHKLIRVDR